MLIGDKNRFSFFRDAFDISENKLKANFALPDARITLVGTDGKGIGGMGGALNTCDCSSMPISATKKVNLMKTMILVLLVALIRLFRLGPLEC